MNYGLSDQVRMVAMDRFVKPAMRAGQTTFSVPVKELMRQLRETGFPEKNWPQVCTAIQAGKFLRENGLVIEGVDGPPKKLSSTVVVRYRITGAGAGAAHTAAHRSDSWAEDASASDEIEVVPVDETPEERISRLLGRIRGVMKDEIAAMGGAEAYMRWVRSDDGDPE